MDGNPEAGRFTVQAVNRSRPAGKFRGRYTGRSVAEVPSGVYTRPTRCTAYKSLN